MHKNFKPGQYVLIEYNYGKNDKNKYTLAIYSHWDSTVKAHCIVGLCMTIADNAIHPYQGNEQLLGKEVTNDIKG